MSNQISEFNFEPNQSSNQISELTFSSNQSSNIILWSASNKIQVQFLTKNSRNGMNWVNMFVFNKFLADPWTIKHLIWLDIDCCPHLAGLFAPFTCSKADFKTKSNFKSISWHQISIKSNIKSNSLMSPWLFLR